MILIRLKPWQEIQGITHVRTKWEVADSETFDNVLESLETKDMLETYFSNIYVPVGATYYVRATRIFDNGAKTTLDPIPTVNYGEDKSSMLLADDVVVDIPFVYVNKDDILSDAATITITTSEFRAVGDDHAYTHWIVMDGESNILYCNLYDKVNKTSLTLDNSYEWKNKTQIKFIAIHGTHTCIESPVGYNLVKLTADYNFEVSGLEWVEPLRDYTVVFRAIDTGKPTNIFKVELLDFTTEELVLELDKTNDNFFIPWYYLKENMKYKLCIYAYDKDLRYGKVYKTLTVATLTNTVIKNANYVYNNKVEESVISKEGDTFMPDLNLHTEVLFHNVILVPNANRELEEWISQDKVITNTKVKANGILLPSTNYDNMLIKPITKGLILIDVIDSEGFPSFLLYSYSNNNNTYALERTIQRKDETIPVGKTNSLIQINTYEFIYNPIGTNKLKLLNIENYTISDLEDIPMENLTKAILIRMDNSAIIICNGPDYKTKIYNYEKKTYIDGFNFGPVSYIGADLRTVGLINGDTAVIKLTEDTSGDPSIVTWDFSANDFIKPRDLVFKQKPPKTTLTCVDGHIHMATYVAGDTTQNIPNMSQVKVYY